MASTHSKGSALCMLCCCCLVGFPDHLLPACLLLSCLAQAPALEPHVLEDIRKVLMLKAFYFQMCHHEMPWSLPVAITENETLSTWHGTGSSRAVLGLDALQSIGPGAV
jgi:hypothetical protein